jgi:hypothetical protein
MTKAHALLILLEYGKPARQLMQQLKERITELSRDRRFRTVRRDQTSMGKASPPEGFSREGVEAAVQGAPLSERPSSLGVPRLRLRAPNDSEIEAACRSAVARDNLDENRHGWFAG